MDEQDMVLAIMGEIGGEYDQNKLYEIFKWLREQFFKVRKLGEKSGAGIGEELERRKWGEGRLVKTHYMRVWNPQ